MCQAIAKPAGVTITRRVLERAWKGNPDGGGYAFLKEDGTVWWQKGFSEFDEFWRAYREHADKDVLLHFRLATHGGKTVDNCHPFALGPNLVMAHNGILSDYTPTHKDDRSDTKIFIDRVLSPALDVTEEKDELLTPAFRVLLEELIGWNRLVFLSPKGFTIINEKQGDWVDGVWWSAGHPDRQYVVSGTEWEENWGDGYGGSVSHGFVSSKAGRHPSKYGRPSTKVVDTRASMTFDNMCIACTEKPQVLDGLCQECTDDVAAMLNNGAEREDVAPERKQLALAVWEESLSDLNAEATAREDMATLKREDAARAEMNALVRNAEESALADINSDSAILQRLNGDSSVSSQYEDGA